MQTLTLLVRSRLVNFSMNILLASVWSVFVWNHIKSFTISGEYALLAFAFSETLQVIFFLIRRSPRTVSIDPFDWLVAGGGTLAPLFLIPGGPVMWQSGEIFVVIAVIFQMFALLSLNRSFAIVAAKRVVKTSGLYRIVRHPMYASYLLLYSGYLLFNGSLMNIGLLILAFTFLFLRIIEEEKHLITDQDYKKYVIRTPWRLIPFIY